MICWQNLKFDHDKVVEIFELYFNSLLHCIQTINHTFNKEMLHFEQFDLKGSGMVIFVTSLHHILNTFLIPYPNIFNTIWTMQLTYLV